MANQAEITAAEVCVLRVLPEHINHDAPLNVIAYVAGLSLVTARPILDRLTELKLVAITSLGHDGLSQPRYRMTFAGLRLRRQHQSTSEKGGA